MVVFSLLTPKGHINSQGSRTWSLGHIGPNQHPEVVCSILMLCWCSAAELPWPARLRVTAECISTAIWEQVTQKLQWFWSKDAHSSWECYKAQLESEPVCKHQNLRPLSYRSGTEGTNKQEPKLVSLVSVRGEWRVPAAEEENTAHVEDVSEAVSVSQLLCCNCYNPLRPSPSLLLWVFSCCIFSLRNDGVLVFFSLEVAAGYRSGAVGTRLWNRSFHMFFSHARESGKRKRGGLCSSWHQYNCATVGSALGQRRSQKCLSLCGREGRLAGRGTLWLAEEGASPCRALPLRPSSAPAANWCPRRPVRGAPTASARRGLGRRCGAGQLERGFSLA